MFLSDSSNFFQAYQHIPPPYILYGSENLCVTHPQANGSSFSYAVAFSAFIGMGEDHFVPIKIGCDATVEYCDHCTAQVAFFTHL